MQRIRIALFATALINSFAAWCQPFNGILMGINGGISQAQVRTQQSAIFNVPNFITVEPNNGDATKINATTGTWGLIVGYAQNVSPCWLVGLEGRAQSARLNLTEQFSVNTKTGASIYAPFSSSVSMQQQYALLGKLGYQLGQQDLLYALVGPVWSKIDLAAEAGFNISLPPFLIATDVMSLASRHQWGYAIGLGMEHEMCSQLSLGLEYSFIDFGALQFPGETQGVFFLNGTVIPGSTSEMLQSFHFRNNQITLRATYYLPIL